jgi:hypothetical protein
MLTLGIVNTYTRIKVLDAHYRTIARAAPVAYVVDFNLALFNFPFNMNSDELTEYVTSRTTIGESGRYLQRLREEGKFFVFDLPRRGFQPQFGTPIVTTSHPAENKKITPREIAEGIQQGKSYLFLIGLGRKGLPEPLFTLAHHHLDITQQGVSLETCTAIAAIPFTIRAHLDFIRRERV